VGLAGGRPNLSFYFVGTQSPDSLIFLDPHIVQQAENFNELKEKSLMKHFHTSDARKLHMSRLDPSMAFAFLLTSRADFNDFVERASLAITSGGEYSFFHLLANNRDVSKNLSQILSMHSGVA